VFKFDQAYKGRAETQKKEKSLKFVYILLFKDMIHNKN